MALKRSIDDINKDLEGLKSRERELREEQGGKLFDYQHAALQHQRERLLSERAGIASDLDRSFFQVLPSKAL